METLRTCRSCGVKMPADTTEGLCLECLSKSAPRSDAGTVVSRPVPREAASFVPPAPADVAKAFPQFEVLALLGSGGMGAVYKARQRSLERLVALKILLPQVAERGGFAERFAREARAMARLNHPHVVAVYDFGQSGGHYYFLMEFVDGMSLRQLLQAHTHTPRECLAVVPQICDALQYAHDEGIVHRDIKPENILLDKKGSVKIADFGLAKLLAVDPQGYHLTQPTQAMGTPYYMAPEQFEKPLEVDRRADIYSLGVVLYEMLTGELPVGRFAPPSQTAGVDARLDEVVLRALEKEPRRRYQQAREVKTDVETIAGIGAKFPPLNAGVLGYEYRSRATLWGLPLLHVATGVDPATGRNRVARGIIAMGETARGVVAFGRTAVGIVACGMVGIGVVSMSALAVGVFALGGGAVGLFWSWGAVSVGPIAIGTVAIGLYAFGNKVWALHPYGSGIRDPAAEAFFGPWVTKFVNRWSMALLVIVPLFMALASTLWLMSKLSARQATKLSRRDKSR